MIVLVEVWVFIPHSYTSLYDYIRAFPPQSQSRGRCCALHVPVVIVDRA
jgi:hypothetical protein